MKKIFIQMLISLATGICFATGFLFIVAIWEGDVFDGNDDKTWIGNPNGVTIANHSIDAESHDFTVTGTIRNDSIHNWDTIHIELDVYADEALVNNCDGDVREVPPDSERKFRVECYQVSGQNLPDNIHYKLRVRSGFRSDQQVHD